MQIAIIGAGVVGVTSAYELAAAGHAVTVFDCGGTIASEASFAPAGLHGAGWALGWSALASSGQLFPPVAWASDPRHWPWSAAWARAHRRSALPALQQRLQDLAAHSQDHLQELTRSLSLEFEHAKGVLVLATTESDSRRMQPALSTLERLGVPHQRLRPEECLAIESGLNPQSLPHSAVHLPQAGIGNCREFAHLMRQHAERLGVRFVFHTQVAGLKPGTRPVLELHARIASAAIDRAVDGGIEKSSAAFDAVVVCSALGARPLLAGCGLRLPLAPVQGHSVTIPLRLDDMSAPSVGPQSAVVDARDRITVTRSGSRVRVSQLSRLGTGSNADARSTIERLYRRLDRWFAGCGRMGQSQHWVGTCAALPDGLPLLGASGLPGVWLNLGHGDLGWALACGSARVLADTLSGRAPAIDTTGLGADRLSR